MVIDTCCITSEGALAFNTCLLTGELGAYVV